MKALKNLFYGTEPLTDDEILSSAAILAMTALTIIIFISELI